MCCPTECHRNVQTGSLYLRMEREGSELVTAQSRDAVFITIAGVGFVIAELQVLDGQKLEAIE